MSFALFSCFRFSAVCTLALLSLLAPQPHAAAAPYVPAPGSADETFLAARDAWQSADRNGFMPLAAKLANHPLASWVEFWQVQLRLRTDERDAVDTAVAAFFARHPGTYLADRLRLEWLQALAARGDYGAFERELPALASNDDPQLRCWAMLVRYTRNEGRRIHDLARDARRLLSTTREAGGDGCLAVSDALIDAGHAPRWERVRMLVEQNQLPAARRSASGSGTSGGDSAQAVAAIDKPAAFLAALDKRPTEVQRDLAQIALARLARDEPAVAARHAQALNSHLSPEQRGIVWGRIGHMAAFKLLPEATDWYRRGGELVGVGLDVARSDEVLEWQVRAALRANDFTMVKNAIERMPTEMRRDHAWTYWHARALAAEGRGGEAQITLRSIAKQATFYGKLAAEELGEPLVLPPRAPASAGEAVEAFYGDDGFERAIRLHELGLHLESAREWNWRLRNGGRAFNDTQLLAAAEFARRRGVLARMISTSERTRGEFDFEQRFPAPHREVLTRHSKTVGLDETFVYGLIRQESRFIQDAKSSAGATGLMQLMPNTARYVARRTGLADFQQAQLTDPDTNVKLGTAYLRLVLDDLDGHAVLASAAYNAGPSRVRAWRSTLTRPVEGAIFAETIPFNETRDYVKKVLSNAVIYASLFGETAPSLRAWLGVVAPKNAGSTNLP